MRNSELTQKMIDFYQGNLHDIAHFIKVYTFAGMIGEAEHLDPEKLDTLEKAAIVHDIACPLCRIKYGNTSGKHQEEESAQLLRDFFKGTDLPAKQLDRIRFLVCHHHTYTGIDDLDYQILLEADYLVNADEGKVDRSSILSFRENVFRTATGKAILDAMYLR